MTDEVVFTWHCRFCKCGGGYTAGATEAQKERVCREAAAHDGCAKFEAAEGARKRLREAGGKP